MDVGSTLKAARERRHLTPEQIAASTRIPLPILRAIERNAFDTIPGGLFTRGYIRAYAREVGLDPEPLVEEFRASTAADADSPDVEPRAGGVPDALAASLADVDAHPQDRTVWAYVVALAVLLVLVVRFVPRDDVAPRSAQELPQVAPVAAARERPDEQAVGTTARADAGSPVATAGLQVGIDIQPRGPCWVEAVVDGERRVYDLLDAGDRVSVEGKDITLRIGDPAVFDYTINGRRGRPVGAAGRPATIRLTPETIAQFAD